MIFIILAVILPSASVNVDISVSAPSSALSNSSSPSYTSGFFALTGGGGHEPRDSSRLTAVAFDGTP